MLIGLDLATFWEITPKQFAKCVKAYGERKKLEAREHDMLNHMLGHYIALAINKPEEYPRKPFLYQDERKEMTAEDMDRVMRSNTLRMGGKINNVNQNT